MSATSTTFYTSGRTMCSDASIATEDTGNAWSAGTEGGLVQSWAQGRGAWLHSRQHVEGLSLGGVAETKEMTTLCTRAMDPVASLQRGSFGTRPRGKREDVSKEMGLVGDTACAERGVVANLPPRGPQESTQQLLFRIFALSYTHIPDTKHTEQLDRLHT